MSQYIYAEHDGDVNYACKYNNAYELIDSELYSSYGDELVLKTNDKGIVLESKADSFGVVPLTQLHHSPSQIIAVSNTNDMLFSLDTETRNFCLSITVPSSEYSLMIQGKCDLAN